jgi:hypothetical protein
VTAVCRRAARGRVAGSEWSVWRVGAGFVDERQVGAVMKMNLYACPGWARPRAGIEFTLSTTASFRST